MSLDYLDYKNERCRIAAEMLITEPNLLEEKLVRKLNEVNWYVNSVADGELRSRQVIALIVFDFKNKKAL